MNLSLTAFFSLIRLTLQAGSRQPSRFLATGPIDGHPNQLALAQETEWSLLMRTSPRWPWGRAGGTHTQGGSDLRPRTTTRELLLLVVSTVTLRLGDTSLGDSGFLAFFLLEVFSLSVIRLLRCRETASVYVQAMLKGALEPRPCVHTTASQGSSLALQTWCQQYCLRVHLCTTNKLVSITNSKLPVTALAFHIQESL